MLHRSFVVLLLAAAALALPASAEAAACSGSSGVTVLVQFPDHTEVGCAAGDPSSGYQALAQAGFHVTFATGNGTGAVCSINSYPDHDCPSMPPQSAYWAYFHAQPGGSWSYSNTGGGSYNPKPGTVEGWRFGSGAAPSSPPPGSSSTPTPKPAPSPTGRPVQHPTSGSSNPVVKPVTSSRPSAATTPTAPDATSASSPTVSSGASPTAARTAGASDGATSPTGSSTDAAAPLSTRDTSADPSSSGGRSWLWGVLLLVLLGGVASATALRRRKA